MKRGFVRHTPHGYTIVEVMVFLAVTGALFVSAVFLIQGQQAKTEFAQAMRDLDSRIRDTINEVTSGYYPNLGNFECQVSGSGAPSFSNPTPSSGAPGTNTDCIFLGKVMQFGVQAPQCNGGATSECTRINVFTLVGRRQTPGGAMPRDLIEARPAALYRTSAPAIEPDKLSTRYGLHITRIVSRGNSYGSVGFLSTLGNFSGTGDLLSGANSIDLITIPFSTLGQPGGIPGAVGPINFLSALPASAIANNTNPSGGVVICVEGGNGKKGAIRIGSQDRKLTTEVLIDQTPAGVCP